MVCYRIRKPLEVSVNLLVALLLAGTSFGKHKTTPDAPPFQYMAGTENIEKGCAGKLEVLKEGITYLPGRNLQHDFFRDHLDAIPARCERQGPGDEDPVEGRPDVPQVSEKTSILRLSQTNRASCARWFCALSENDMRPYFAEIELQSGKSVQEFRSFDEFNDVIRPQRDSCASLNHHAARRFTLVKPSGAGPDLRPWPPHFHLDRVESWLDRVWWAHTPVRTGCESRWRFRFSACCTVSFPHF